MLLFPVHAQQQGQADEPAGDAPPGSMVVTWTYSHQAKECPPYYPCTDVKTVEDFSGNATLRVVDGGFEGRGEGGYSYSTDSVTQPAAGCPGGMNSRTAHSGRADFVVHAQCSIDNDVTGGPDTSQYDRSTSVVEVLIEDRELHLESDRRDCDGTRESWTSEEGSVGLDCHFYGVDFGEGGSYVSHEEVTADSRGTCTLTFNPPTGGPRLRIYGTVKGLIDGESPVPISNARVVMANLGEERLQKLSVSKPMFRKKTTTSDDEDAKYEIKSGFCGDPPKVVVVSTLWYEGPPVFAITNGPPPSPGRPGISVYLAACVDQDPRSKCHKWKKVGSDYEVEVNFEYGNDDQIDRQLTFMDSEDWVGFSTERKLMMESAQIYYDTYRGVEYFEQLGLGYPTNPFMVRSHYLGETCVDRPYGAWYKDVDYSFGDLGRHLELVQGTGGGIFICSAESVVGLNEAPVNREWHELGHYLQYQMYFPLKGCPNCEDHGGFKNDNTSWSLIEGFAEFTAALTNRHYGDANAEMYPLGDTMVSLELNYKAWGEDNIDEELAVAGVLWDLFDPGKEIGIRQMSNGALIDISRVYPAPVDEVSLADEQILQVIQKGKPRTVVDLYSLFAGWYAPRVEADMNFLDHGFFADTVERNFIHDSTAEKIPESGHAPARLRRESPPPTFPGSYLVAETDAMFEVAIKVPQGNGQYDYTYRLEMKRNVPAYFTMPPEYYPSTAVFTPLSREGKKLAGGLQISSQEYWTYIRSGPPTTGVFKRIPAGAVGER